MLFYEMFINHKNNMTSLFNKAVYAAHNKLGKVNDLLNGPDPRFVSYKENGKDKKIEHLNLDSDHCRSFIGKMKIDGSGTYSDEVITALLKYFFDHTKSWEKVVIELANKVSELLNWEGSMDGYLHYEEQKTHILELAQELNKKRAKDLEIPDIQNNNKRLFDVLQHEGIQWLTTSEFSLPNPYTFDSLDIAKSLFYVAQHDPKYLEELRDLKRGELKQMEGESDYYWLVELAIRINALLHGITLQSWIALQKKYDALLLKHINPYVKDFPLLESFQKFCWDKLWSETFKGLYFDTEWSEKLVSKLDAKKHLQSKAKNALLLTLWLGVGIWATNLTNNYIQTQKQKKATEETIKEIFENKKATRSGDMWYGEYEWEMKMKEIHRYKDKIYHRFLFRYGSIGKFTEEWFKAKILDCLNNQKILDQFWSEYSLSDVALEDDVIDNYLIPQNMSEFKLNDVSTIPYEKLIPYTDQFINTILCDKSIIIVNDSTYKDQLLSTGYLTKPLLKPIWAFTPKYVWKSQFSFYSYDLAITQLPNSDKQYVLASWWYIDVQDKEPYELSSDRAKDLAIDFLKQTNPILLELIDQYVTRYYELEQLHVTNQDWPEKNPINKQVEYLLIKDFMQKGLYKKIHKWDHQKLLAYLDKFVLENQKVLKPLNADVNPNLLPNWFLLEYEEAMKNTIQEERGVLDTLGRLPVSDSGENQTVSHIGIYLASDWKTYKLWIVEINAKKYFYAKEIWRPDYWMEIYGTYEWVMVAKDYFKTKAKFMEQKLLRQKKQKSASQRHIDKPRDLLHNSWIWSNQIKFPIYPKR